MLITMQFNNDTKDIAVNDRIIKFRSPWTVIALNTTLEGLLILTCKMDGIVSGDDIANEIPSHGENHTYTLNVDPSTINIASGNTQQITAKAQDEKGNLVISATYTYSSDNANIATVNDKGLVTGVSVGTCNITVVYVDGSNKTYTKIISTTITTPATINYVINGQDKLNIKKQATYTIVYDNGGNTTGNFTWSIVINNAEIISQSGTSCTIKGIKAGNIKLVATDGINTIFKVIMITDY